MTAAYQDWPVSWGISKVLSWISPVVAYANLPKLFKSGYKLGILLKMGCVPIRFLKGTHGNL
jgi:hypothetical protein